MINFLYLIRSVFCDLHYNLFITLFIITLFWLLDGSKMDPKNVYIILKKDLKMVIFQYNLYIFVWL